MAFDVLGIVAPHPPIMVEEVGGSEAGVTSASAEAMRSLGSLLERFAPDTVVLVSPHAPSFADAFSVAAAPRVSGDLGRFRAPGVAHDVAGDPELALAVLEEALAA